MTCKVDEVFQPPDGHSHHNLQIKLGLIHRHIINQRNVSRTYVEPLLIQNTHRKQTITYTERTVTCVVSEKSVKVILQLPNIFLPRHISVSIMVHYLVHQVSTVLNCVP